MAAKKQADDAGEEQVQELVDEAAEQGAFGTLTDPTPNENYTMGGADLPTPETDAELAEKARKASGGSPGPAPEEG